MLIVVLAFEKGFSINVCCCHYMVGVQCGMSARHCVDHMVCTGLSRANHINTIYVSNNLVLETASQSLVARGAGIIASVVS